MVRTRVQTPETQNKEGELKSWGGGGEAAGVLLECLLHFPTLPTQTGSVTRYS